MNELNRAEMKDEDARMREFVHQEHVEMLAYLKSIQQKINRLEKKIEKEESKEK